MIGREEDWEGRGLRCAWRGGGVMGIYSLGSLDFRFLAIGTPLFFLVSCLLGRTWNFCKRPIKTLGI